MPHRPDRWLIENTHNTARFFTENRHVSWTVLIFTVFAGVFGYFRMPQSKDPDVPVRVALAICNWPGVETRKVEQLVTRKIEQKVAENVTVDKIESTTRIGASFVYITLKEDVEDTGKQFDDIKMRLDAIGDLPEGAGPIVFVKDFGTTAALMLTVASPKVGDVQIGLRARVIRAAIEAVRRQADPAAGPRASILYCFPPDLAALAVRRQIELFLNIATPEGAVRDGRVIEGSGFMGFDCATDYDDDRLRAYGQAFVAQRLRSSEFHPDVWGPALVRDPTETEARLAEVAGDKYTYRELDEYTDLLQRTLQTVPEVSKVDRAGVLEPRVFLTYSQARLAAYDLNVARLSDVLSARNAPASGGVVEIEGKNVTIDPSGEFENEKQIGDVIVGTSGSGPPVYLRDIVDIDRGYESPPRYLNFYTWRDSAGRWQRTRAITLAAQMRVGQKIAVFGDHVDAALADVRQRLPEDLIYARTSDQPLQVRESIDLFMNSLFEAVVLVVVIALIGFWEWRSALLMAISIPLTLAMTFGFMAFMKVDLQQISIGSLIIALGLLVDDPVVAGDAIKRSLADRHPPIVAAWLGPTKLATAILFATVTNIVAYLPFLLLPGDVGRFLRTLPIVLTCSLVASRLVSMTFIPLIGYHILRPGRKAPTLLAERRAHGFTGRYYRLGRAAIRHRWRVFAASVVFLVLGGVIFSRLRTQFFPKDLSYFSYVDVWLPEDATLDATRAAATQVEQAVLAGAAEYGNLHNHGHGKKGEDSEVLRSLTTFVGGGGPRFWFSVSPEPRQQNYAQIIIQARNKHETGHLVEYLQATVPAQVPGARVNVRELESGASVGIPVSIRLSGDDLDVLRAQGRKLADIFRTLPSAERVQDDWGVESFLVNLAIDPDRANMAGLTNLDAARSTSGALNGMKVATLREGDKQIPVLARLRMEERAQLSDLENLYVYAGQATTRAPLRQISRLAYSMEPEKIVRRSQFRTMTVSCFPVEGLLPSQVLRAATPRLREFEKQLPLGFYMEIGGEGEKQTEQFHNLAVVMAVSIASIFMALVLQFRNAVKPMLVFAAIPYGMMGAVTALWIMGAPFGFMAFLGVASLVGVIVSHVIVLFDFIEEAHAAGEPLEEALLDAGIVRLRPVLITVGATVFALFPLAAHGGPLWEPLCYAQIGGLLSATVITLVLVPVLYSIFVLDLKIVKWEKPPAAAVVAIGSSDHIRA
jgi:multidrug efflux pump subunit AcrB